MVACGCDRIEEKKTMQHLKPIEILNEIAGAGENRANAAFSKLFIMGIMAGAYIAFAGAGANMASYGLLGNPETYGLGRLAMGAVFVGGLIMVVLAGAELFTGNTLITVAVMQKKTSVAKMLRNWGIVYIANFIGAVIVAALVYYSGALNAGNGYLGAMTVKIAAGKVNLSFLQCLFSGILCNWLVCLAVWISHGAQGTLDKVAGVFFPILLFVVAGYEHSIANMYFISAGIFGSKEELFVALNGAMDLSNLTWIGMFANNLLPVTIGNIVGGVVFVAMGYGFALKER